MIKLRTGIALISAAAGLSACTSVLGGFDFEGNTGSSSGTSNGGGGSGPSASSSGGGDASNTGTGASTASSSSGGMACTSDGDCPDTGTSCATKVCKNHVCTTDNVGVNTACHEGNGVKCDGNGACVQCVSSSECPATNNECTYAKCDGTGTCTVANVDKNTPLAKDTPNDCKTDVCDGNGNPTKIVNTNDLPQNNEVCVVASCAADGTEVFTGVTKRTACHENGGSFCTGPTDPNPTCVECIDPGDCASGVCGADHQCASAQCGDTVQNGFESDTDCGGIDLGSGCGPCADTKKCVQSDDCASNNCVTGHCVAGTCNDGILNPLETGETDVDCGGPCPTKCAATKACINDTDCKGGQCKNSVCAPTCTDGQQNQGESDTDCGGANCSYCAVGLKCVTSADCGYPTFTSNGCVAGKCKAPTCNDGVLDGNETDTDCGGNTCGKCAATQKCATASDCATGFCIANVCDYNTLTTGIVGATINGLIVSPNYAYYTVLGSSSSTVYSVSNKVTVPTAPTPLLSSTQLPALSNPQKIAFSPDGGTGFVTAANSNSVIKFNPTLSNSGSVIVNGTENYPQSIIADASYIYWTDANSSQLRRATYAGGSVVTVGTQGFISGIGLDSAGNNYITSIQAAANGGHIFEVNPGAKTQLTATAVDYPRHPTYSGGSVFFSTGNVAPYLVQRVAAVANSNPVVMSPDQGAFITDLTTDGVNVYWCTNNGAIGKVPVAGKPTDVTYIATGEKNSPQAIAVQDKYVYWVGTSGVVRQALK